MTKDEALKLALEALELEDMACRYEKDQTPEHITKAIIAIKEALAQQNQFNPDWDAMAVMVEEQQRMAKRIAELEAQQEQEPVAWELRHGKTDRVLIEITNDPRRAHNWKASLEEVVPLYTTPPHRKPLTSGEIYTAYITATNQTLRAQDERLAFAFARAIEAAHGIKE